MTEGVHIRPATPDDAEAWLALMTRIDGETPFMLYEPGERPQDPALMRARRTREREHGAGVTLLVDGVYVDDYLMGKLLL